MIVGNFSARSSAKTSFFQSTLMNLSFVSNHCQVVLYGFHHKSHIENFFNSLICFNRVSNSCISFSLVKIIQESANPLTFGYLDTSILILFSSIRRLDRYSAYSFG